MLTPLSIAFILCGCKWHRLEFLQMLIYSFTFYHDLGSFFGSLNSFQYSGVLFILDIMWNTHMFIFHLLAVNRAFGSLGSPRWWNDQPVFFFFSLSQEKVHSLGKASVEVLCSCPGCDTHPRPPPLVPNSVAWQLMSTAQDGARFGQSIPNLNAIILVWNTSAKQGHTSQV